MTENIEEYSTIFNIHVDFLNLDHLPLFSTSISSVDKSQKFEEYTSVNSS